MGVDTKSAVAGGAILVVVAMLAGGTLFSGLGDATDQAREIVNGPDNTSDNTNSIRDGVSADLSLAAYDQTQDSTTQVAADMYTWIEGGEFFLGSQTGSASDRTLFDVNTGDSFTSIAFNSQYPYGESVSGEVDEATERRNLDVYDGVSTSNLDLVIDNNDGEEVSSSVALGNNQEYSFTGIDLTVDASDAAYNPQTVTIAYSENISSVSMGDEATVETPETAKDAVDAANYVSFTPGLQHTNGENSGEAATPSEGAPSMMGWDSVTTNSNLVVTAGDEGTSSGDSMTVIVQDMAPYINSNNELQYGVEDDSSIPTDSGVPVKTSTVNFAAP